jgi:hypothetical protein
LTGIVYWSAQRLQRAPVLPKHEISISTAESIQAKVEHYLDQSGLSRRLVRSIERADGGVYGITGVRGAGKSALTRHVLHSLQDDYFVTEVTAPVRHDDDMGFFIAVCRNVCGKVIDDLEPILQGARETAQTKLLLRARNVVVLLLVLTGVVLALNVGSGVAVTPKVGMKTSEHPFVEMRDPVLGPAYAYEVYPLKAERIVVDDLLVQLRHALLSETKSQRRLNAGIHYLIVPNPGTEHFLLLQQHPGTDVNDDLLSYRNSVKYESLDTFEFFSSFSQHR